MKNFLFLVIALFTFQISDAQEQTVQSQDTIYDAKVLENKPDFPDGISAFFKFIAKNFQIPDVEALNGKIIVAFVIEVDGSITNINILQDIGYGTKEEVIRVLNKSSKWNPGMLDGKPVRSQYTLPITIVAPN